MPTLDDHFRVERLHVIMSPRAGDDLEVEGVLNPATARDREGTLYVFPRLVAKNNYSRIGVGRIIFENDVPVSVERLGVALEPEADYEFNAVTAGCEDPRITYMPDLNRYLMTYTAFSAAGPRIALAVSRDLRAWQRLGLVQFAPYSDEVDFDQVDNKDALLFPELIPDPHGRPSIGLIHRPLFPGTKPLSLVKQLFPRRVDRRHESLWISYWPVTGSADELNEPIFREHHRLASPVERWERVKVGGGTPPVMTPLGWLVLYHGVSGDPGTNGRPRRLTYSAGVLILDRDDPRRIVYRSREPIMVPDLPTEKQGIVANVVFPTGIDQRTDISRPDRFDFYYGMADNRIGVAKLAMPDALPDTATRDAPGDV